MLSTSSAGYAGLGVFLVGFVVLAFGLGLLARRRRIAMIALGTVGGGILLASLVVLFLPSVATMAQGVISESLLNKATTDSALERGSWNAQAWQVFLDTHGIGAGIGGTRASNYALVLLSNLGVIGFALFVLLVLRVTSSQLAPNIVDKGRAMVWAARIGILTSIVPSLLVGTVYDLGALFYGLVGIAASGAVVRRRSESVADGTRIRQPSSRPIATLAK